MQYAVLRLSVILFKLTLSKFSFVLYLSLIHILLDKILLQLVKYTFFSAFGIVWYHDIQFIYNLYNMYSLYVVEEGPGRCGIKEIQDKKQKEVWVGGKRRRREENRKIC